MNEATSDTAGQYTIDSGTPGFTSTGGLYAPTVGQQVTFTTPNWVLGYVGFSINEAVMGTGTIANYDITYSLDKNDGNGYGSFHNLYYARPGGSGTSGEFTFTVTNATGVEIGDQVWGTGIGYNARVTNLVGNTITVDIANVATVSGIIRFNHLPYETGLDATLGLKLKIRIYTAIANTTAITSLYAFVTSTEASRAVQYPLDVVAVTVTPVAVGSEVRAYLTGTATEVDGVESAAGTSVVLSLLSGVAVDIKIECYDPPMSPLQRNNLSFTSSQSWDPVQRPDANFRNAA